MNPKSTLPPPAPSQTTSENAPFAPIPTVPIQGPGPCPRFAGQSLTECLEDQGAPYLGFHLEPVPAPPVPKKRRRALAEEDPDRILGKSPRLSLVGNHRHRSEPLSVAVAARLVASQSTRSLPTQQGSRATARALPLDNTRKARQPEPPTRSTDHGHHPPPPKTSFLVRTVKRLVQLLPRAVHHPSLDFGATPKAAAHNWQLLKAKENSLARLISEQPFSVMTIGSEFRPVDELAGLLSSHPLWPRWEEGLTAGASYPLEPYTSEEMRLDLVAQLARGNHQSAKDCNHVLDKLNETDTSRGYSFCLPVAALHDIEDAVVAPHGVIHQGTIDETGRHVSKDRPTHDQSFVARPGGRSINDRCLMERLTPIMFGHALLRIIHFVLRTRAKFPTRRIFLQKVDFKAAYRRMHLSTKMASKCITVVRDLAFLSLRLPFGGRACPSLFADLSETITDLTNALAADKSWDPTDLQSPLQHLIPATITEPDDVPFGQTLEMSVYPDSPDGEFQADVYLDDVISAVLDDLAGCLRGSAASLLAIHAVGRPVASNEPVARDELTAEKKLIAESLLEEVKTVLGWTLDTRRLLIGLTMEKYSTWAAAVYFYLIVESVRYEELETLVGRLNHVCFVIPLARHFMSRIRRLLDKSPRGRRTRLRPQVLADLRLWLGFLSLAHAGLSLNLVSFRAPTHVFRTDAAEHGIGGFCGASGRAWQIELPPDCRVGCRHGITLNLFEFLGSILGIWIELLAGGIPEHSCLLAQGDSTTATGWLKKSNFEEGNHPLQLEAARHLAFLLLEAQVVLYSQWFPGAENGTADVLSRDTHLSTSELTQLLVSNVPEQVPPNFAICPLPAVASSWLISLLRSQPPTGASKKEPTRSTIWLGRGGKPGSIPSSCETTSSSKVSTLAPVSGCSELSRRQSEPRDFQGQLIASLLPRQFPIPSTMWQRPFWTPEPRTLGFPTPGPLHAFYSVSIGATEPKTRT